MNIKDIEYNIPFAFDFDCKNCDGNIKNPSWVYENVRFDRGNFLNIENVYFLRCLKSPNKDSINKIFVLSRKFVEQQKIVLVTQSYTIQN